MSRWKSFARRAAQVQAAAVLWLLYYLLLVPIALVRRVVVRAPRHRAAPAWQPRPTHAADLPSVRRQF